LANESQNDQPFAGWAIIQPSYKGNPRYFLVGSKAIFKQIRVEGGKMLFVEMLNELVCHSLGKRLGIPLVNTILGILPTQGLGLFSILLGEQPFNPNDANLKSEISNISKLKELFVFDQWIYNDDRRADHIMIGSEPTLPNIKVLYALDNGHTLNGYNGQKWTLETLNDDILKAVGQVCFDSGISNYTELANIISKIKSLKEDDIDKIIDDAVGVLEQFRLTAEELTQVKNNAEILKKMLKKRREYIEEIIKTWCDKNGKPC